MTRKTIATIIITTVTGIVVGVGATLGVTFATAAATPEPEPETVVQYEVVEVEVVSEVCQNAAERLEGFLVDQIITSIDYREAATQAELAEIDARFEADMNAYGDTIAPLVDACRGPNT